MKKLVIILIAATLMAVTVACGGESEKKPGQSTTPAVSTTPESTTPESTTPESTTPESTTPESTTPESTTPESSTDPVTPPASDDEYNAGDILEFNELFTRRETYNGFSFVRIMGENVVPFTYVARAGTYNCDNNHARFYIGGDGKPAISSWNNNTAAIRFTAPVSGTYTFDLSVHRWHNAAENTASFYFLKGGEKLGQTFITTGNAVTQLPVQTLTLEAGQSICIVYECGATGAGNDTATIDSITVTLVSKNA